MATSQEPVEKTMENKLYVAVAEGKVEILVEDMNNDINLRSKTYKSNNIIHIAIRHEQHDFVKACLIKFPENDAFSDENSDGNTPLHVAAEVGNSRIVELLYDFLVDKKLSWKVENSKGNTPLHIAIIHDNVDIARFLLERISGLAEIVNKSKEAPLHLAIKQHVIYCKFILNYLCFYFIIHDSVDIARFLLEKNSEFAEIVNYSKEATLHLAIKQHVIYSECDSLLARARKPLKEGGAGLTIKSSAPQEDMSDMIKLLVQKASIVTCWPNAKGLTPLHLVASLSKPHNVELTNFILDHCRQSAEVCDSSGKSILHLLVNKIPDYHEIKNLLSRREMLALRNYQDDQGNTPLHIAAKNKDINMVRFLLESSVKLNINNVDGCSVASLIGQDLLQMLRNRILTKEENDATEKANINFLNERMSKLEMDFLLSRDSTGKNILHKTASIKTGSCIMKDDFLNFVKKSLDTFPSLVSQKDSKGDTPIHVLVRNDPNTPIRAASSDNSDGVVLSLWESELLPSLLNIFNQCILKEVSVNGAGFNSPWLVQNGEGNTPLHEAIKSNNNVKLVKLLLSFNKDQLCVPNKSKDTPLHLFAKRPTAMYQFGRGDVKEVVNANVQAAYWLDKDDLTPLLRALKTGNYVTASMLCKASPAAAQASNSNSQTYGHLIVKHPSEYYFSSLFKDKELRNLLKLKDANGNTPLHQAITDERFDLVRFFLKFWNDERNSSKGTYDQSWLLELLDLPNRSGKTPSDLLAESSVLPFDIRKTILGEKEMIGVLSIWGIPSKEMQTYVNTIGIIAALLTTVTFTTAFTVPGGLLESKGTPVLIDNIVFQIFMVLDILAMSLSMMVLCCLLWIMATSNRKNSVMILDFSITMVLASFGATLFTFMAGLCATTLPVKAWMGYLTFVLCTLLIPLLHKDFIINFLIPLKNRFVVNVRKCSSCVSRTKTVLSSSPGAGSQKPPHQGSTDNNV